MILIKEKNKYEFDDLFNSVIETEDKFLNKKLNSNICFGGKGGGGQQQQDIAPTLKPYVTDVLSRAKGEFQQPYQQYPGERIVGFMPQELAAQEGIQQMAGQYGLASMSPELTSSAAYYSPAYGYLGQTGQALGQQAGALAEAPRLFGTQEALYGEALRPISGIQQQLTGAGALLGEAGMRQRAAARDIGREEVGRFGLTSEDIQQYMDPYQQAVIDIEKAQAQQDALQTAQAIAAKSAGAGAFGGSRQAILESQAASDLAERLSNIQTRGSQAAYQQALQTAAQQQQVGLGQAAQQRAREQQLGAGIAGLAGARQQLGVGGYGSMAEQLRQAGAGFGGLGGQYGQLAGQYGQLGGGLGALSGQYGALGQQALGQGYRELGYLSGVGEAQRGLGQQRADVAYQDFREARDYPTQQLERYAGMAFGVPSGYLSRPQATPSGFQQAVGGLATLGGLGQGLRFFKEGGDIGKGGLSTVYRNTAGKVRPDILDFTRGDIADLQRRYEAETNPEKKEDLRRKLLIKGGEQLQSSTMVRRFADPDIMNPVDYFNTVIANQPDDTGLERFGKFAGRTALAIPGEIIDLYKGAAGATRQVREYLTTPLNTLAEQKAIEEEQFKTYEDAQANAETTPEESGSELALLYAAQNKDITNRASSLEDLKKLTEEAFKFDKEKKAKSIKAQQGFDIAALGMQLMSKPLEEIDPAYIRQLGVSGKELDELDQEEAMSKYKAKAAEYGLKEIEAKIEALKAPFSVTPTQINQAAALITGAESPDAATQIAQNFYTEAYNSGLNETSANQYVLNRIAEINENPSSYLNQNKGLASDKLNIAQNRQDALR